MDGKQAAKPTARRTTVREFDNRASDCVVIDAEIDGHNKTVDLTMTLSTQWSEIRLKTWTSWRWDWRVRFGIDEGEFAITAGKTAFPHKHRLFQNGVGAGQRVQISETKSGKRTETGTYAIEVGAAASATGPSGSLKAQVGRTDSIEEASQNGVTYENERVQIQPKGELQAPKWDISSGSPGIPLRANFASWPIAVFEEHSYPVDFEFEFKSPVSAFLVLNVDGIPFQRKSDRDRLALKARLKQYLYERFSCLSRGKLRYE